jgi:hypothetical protein
MIRRLFNIASVAGLVVSVGLWAISYAPIGPTLASRMTNSVPGAKPGLCLQSNSVFTIRLGQCDDTSYTLGVGRGDVLIGGYRDISKRFPGGLPVMVRIPVRRVSLAIVFSFLAVSLFLTSLMGRGRRRRARHGCCEHCGYDLRGSPEGACSECGVDTALAG